RARRARERLTLRDPVIHGDHPRSPNVVMDYRDSPAPWLAVRSPGRGGPVMAKKMIEAAALPRKKTPALQPAEVFRLRGEKSHRRKNRARLAAARRARENVRPGSIC
ncbi:MAG TPA: hypothetical protein VHD34_03255, partial [Xanthobacteraceae bacterium]|nr:hypothetical protein [Xanthobacteraceae bacterium]